jgi:hypothetical protein
MVTIAEPDELPELVLPDLGGDPADPDATPVFDPETFVAAPDDDEPVDELPLDDAGPEELEHAEPAKGSTRASAQKVRVDKFLIVVKTKGGPSS